MLNARFKISVDGFKKIFTMEWCVKAQQRIAEQAFK